MPGNEVYVPKALRMWVDEVSFKAVVLALSIQSRRCRQEILEALEPSSVRIINVPDMAEFVASSARLEDLRYVDASDPLGHSSWRIEA